MKNFFHVWMCDTIQKSKPHMSFIPKAIAIGIGVFVVLLAGVMLLTFWLEEKPELMPEEAKSREEALPKKEAPIKSIPSAVPQSTVAPDSTRDLLPSVRFGNGGFLPAKIIVEKKEVEGVECFLTIVNESKEMLTVRLGPHESGKEKGFPYAPIAPGGQSVIDPRYTGIADAVFYNISNPAQQFAAHIDSSCK